MATFALGFGIVSCGGDDADDAPDTIETVPVTAGSSSSSTGTGAETSGDGDRTEDGDAPPPAEDQGTITVAGTTTEVGDADLDICETVNPAFDDDFNIMTSLSDGTQFRLDGTLGEMDPELDGLFLGQIPEQEQATDLEVSRDGRTISGTATVAAGAVAFSFSC